ncbi:hypothetical protein [Thiocapsa sp.]|uniref:hypothetical protein n=1 Tax=Thiocapsa sp. TaxID=2024551 RepID=UPI002C7AD415|nr:hypothetical protein [Thiocapsa sp.]HSO82439.1 hypothetical protein [Thiocapsa sp.]
MTAIDCRRVPAKDSPSGAVRLPCLGGISAAALADCGTPTLSGSSSLVGMLSFSSLESAAIPVDDRHRVTGLSTMVPPAAPSHRMASPG